MRQPQVACFFWPRASGYNRYFGVILFRPRQGQKLVEFRAGFVFSQTRQR